MTTEIEFSIMDANGERIRPLLDRFEAETGIKVRLRLLAWDSAWSMFVRAALYGDGPDVSEVGTTWISDLIGMNALRPFDSAEVAILGREQAFFPAAWKSATRPVGPGRTLDRIWSIPWLTGARLIFYRPGQLQRAGIDPQRAFETNAALEETVLRLQSAGVRVPWTVPTGYTHTTLLNIASWVWAAGGDFIREDGRATTFMQPAALQGLRDYFALGRCLTPEVRQLNGLEPDDYFLSNADTAMTVSGPWLFGRARSAGVGDIDLALPPGASFVGGSNLVIWKYSQHADAAMRLVFFLTQHAAQESYCPVIGLLPVKQDSLERPPFSSDPFWMTAVRALKSGRTFPNIRLWGLIEDRMTAGLSAVWNSVLAGEAIEEALQKHLAPLAYRLDQLLKQE